MRGLVYIAAVLMLPLLASGCASSPGTAPTPLREATAPTVDLDARMEWAQVGPHVYARYQKIGTAKNTVVLLHELGNALEAWDEVVPYLASSERSVLRYDLRGAGMSTKIRTPITMQDWVDDLKGLLDTLDITTPVVLAGDTFGASVALLFASAYPERVSGVVAMGPTAYLDPQPERVAKFADPLAPGAAPSTLAMGVDPQTPGAQQKGRQREFQAVYPQVLRTDAGRLERFHGLAYSTDPTSALLTLRAVYAWGFRDAFAAIKVPVLVTAGTMFMRPMNEFREMAAAIPGARFVEMKTGHYAAIQSPELSGPTILEFMKELGR